jgi:hypothetical protein
MAVAALATAMAMAAASAHAATLFPAADSYVAAGHANHNLGRLPLLAVARHPAMRSYVRFTLPASKARLRKATLYLYSLRDSRHGVRVHRAAGTRWNERAITWRHMPRAAHRSVVSGPLHKDAWTAVDVTSLLSGSRVVDLALTGRGSDRVILRSKENGFTAPRLVVDYNAVTTLPTAPRPAPRPAPAPVPVPPAPAPGITPTSAKPCGVSTAPPVGGWQHVVWIVMENKTYSNIIGNTAGAPFINGLASKCGLATQFFAESHPSLPNYIAMTSGSTQGIRDDNGPSSHQLNVPSIFSQLGAGGWRSLEEDMPSNCAQGDSGLYAVRHNPAAYYTNISSQCATQDVKLTDPPDLSAKFTFITPNECDDMHSCPSGSSSAAQIHNGDTWLATWMPKILDSPQYKAGNTVVFLTWDEDDYSADQHIATIVMAPSTPTGGQGATKFDHYSMLRTTEEILGLPLLGSAAGAATMKADFHL